MRPFHQGQQLGSAPGRLQGVADGGPVWGGGAAGGLGQQQLLTHGPRGNFAGGRGRHRHRGDGDRILFYANVFRVYCRLQSILCLKASVGTTW